MGFSFAIFYTLFGIPLGRLADSKSRRTIIAVGLIFWSIASAGCGLAQRYWQLLFMRMGVGVGEATLSPSAYSLITDYVPPHRLGLAISLYGMGIYIGSGMAYLLGGVVVKFTMGADQIIFPLLGEVKPWQVVFFVVGLPGVFFAAFLYTIKEPIRRTIAAGGASIAQVHAPVSFGAVMQYVGGNTATFICHTFGFALLALVSYACAGWVPTFFARIHGWTPAETGVRYGTVVMIVGSIGILFGGFMADRLKQRGSLDSKMRVGFYAALACIPFGATFPLMTSPWMALALLGAATFFLAIPFGVAPAAIQEMMPNSMRGQASAIYLFVVNLIGMGMGPTSVAWCTDFVFHDEAMVHHSLAWVNLFGGLSAALLLGLGLRPFRNSITYLHDWHESRTTAEA
jgi:MFS family permease